MTGDGSEFIDSADEFDDDVEDRDDDSVDTDEVNSRSDQSAFSRLVNDPAIVVYRRRVSSNAPLRWITHNIHAVLGYRSEDLLTSEFGSVVDTWSALVHRDSVDRYRRFLASLLSVDKARCLYQILAADGGYRFIREEARVVRNAEEEAIDIVGCLIDWTDLTTIRYNDSIGDFDGGSVARRYRMRELEMVADLLATHSYIRQQARGYRDVVQTLTQITDRLQASASQGGINGLMAGVAPGTAKDAAKSFNGDLLPIGIYHARPTASRTLSRANEEMARLVNFDHHNVDRENLSGFELSSVTTPDIARTNEETVDLAMRTREDFDLVYPVVERSTDSSSGEAGGLDTESGWTRWIWEQGRVEYDANNQPIAIHGVVADVTDSMATETGNVDTSRQSKIPFEGAYSNFHLGGQPADRDGRSAFVGSSDLFDIDNSLNEFMAGPIREPMAAEDEVVAVFSSSNMLETDHPTVELVPQAEDADAEAIPPATSRDPERDASSLAQSPDDDSQFRELSDMGAEIASWDSDVVAASDSGWQEPNPESDDFDFLGDDMPYYLDSLSDDQGQAVSEFRLDDVDASAAPAAPAGERHDAESAAHALSGDVFDHFRLYAQPAFAVTSTAEPVYLEVLLRLQDSEGKLLAPADFKLFKTDPRTQVEVDQWVVREAINSLRFLSERESNVGISVNISAHTLTDEAFVSGLEAQLAAADVAASRISFEISDPQSRSAKDSLAAMLKRVAASGCRLTLDNFSGDGITLEQLKRLAVDQIKIDGDLIRNFASNEVDRSIISSICQVARELGVSVTAQHVENIDAVDGLAELGVDIVQGNGLAVVMPIELFGDFQSAPDQPSVAH